MRREPLALAGLVIVLVKAVLAWLTIMGIFDLSEAQQQATVTLAVAVVDVSVVVGALVWGRSKVTPLSSPRDNEGHFLMRADGSDAVE